MADGRRGRIPSRRGIWNGHDAVDAFTNTHGSRGRRVERSEVVSTLPVRRSGNRETRNQAGKRCGFFCTGPYYRHRGVGEQNRTCQDEADGCRGLYLLWPEKAKARVTQGEASTTDRPSNGVVTEALA